MNISYFPPCYVVVRFRAVSPRLLKCLPLKDRQNLPHSPALTVQEHRAGVLPKRFADGRQAEGRGEGVRVGAQRAVTAHLVCREVAGAFVPLLLLLLLPLPLLLGGAQSGL